MAQTEVSTYCRICEPQCGLIATVDDGKLLSISADKKHVHSKGFSCVKSSAAVELATDPDRVLKPLKRVGGPGEFVEVSWDEALTDITRRLSAIRSAHGKDAFATFLGNPPAFGFAAVTWLTGLQQTLGVRWRYSINTEDTASRMAASALLYGSAAHFPKPDLWRTSYVVLIGANPVVSHGSLIAEPLFREALESVVERGGRVIVVDPRRTETARRFDHVAVRAGADAYLLLGMLNVLFAEDLVDSSFLKRWTTGADELAEIVRGYPPEVCAHRCEIPAETIREMAVGFGRASSAVVYGRTGTCTQQFGTLNNILQDLLMVVTGNIAKEGGWVFGSGIIDFARLARMMKMDTYGALRARTVDRPDVFGVLPSTALATDITTPGQGQVKALLTVGGNPVNSSAGGGPRLIEALESLDLHFSIDLYVNDTNAYAHYVLPTTHMFEREDFPVLAMEGMLRPAIWATDRVVDPPEQVRPEWEILQEIARRMGYGGAYSVAPLRRLAKIGIQVKPRAFVDVLVRTSPVGDLFGLRRGGVSIKKLLRDHPHGKQVSPHVPIASLGHILRTADKKIALALPQMLDELARLQDVKSDPTYPLRLHGMRETRSHNSWMHNVGRLMPSSRKLTARISVVDATAAGLADGDLATITSKAGRVTVPVTVTDDMSAGNIALPHGWGHQGGWRRANAAGGVNSNVLASGLVEDLEVLAGMSVLNGIPVRVERAAESAVQG
ncbi:molybdopterin-containing oxidoreductase family protein [Mycobacterium kyogaense]|uniref:molybdopterin-containing oxidoreductase family protein n=1 Tax=Mycobacterium kyogaense TaxID=2212479 RepID=UPI0013C48544|nr:molybdopterin-dependent oxidoreductase [Mycobacterium kyogaense]